MATSAGNEKPRIAVFSGPTATIQNSEPLVTSNKAREKYGLPPRTHEDGTPMRFDVLRPQRLAAPITVYVEQFSAPSARARCRRALRAARRLSRRRGVFHKERTSLTRQTGLRIMLQPEDGLYPLAVHGAAGQRAGLGNGRYGKECAG